MALANFTPYYKPSAGICRMKEDLAILPAWYAPIGSMIKTAGGNALNQLQESCDFLPDVKETARWIPAILRPWGWDPALCHNARIEGFPSERLPSESWLEHIRYLSARPQAKLFLDELRVRFPHTCGEMAECHNLMQVKAAVGYYGKSLLKAPWSGSGRGLVATSPTLWDQNVENRVARILRGQGTIMVEPMYGKVKDLAMEFQADGKGNVQFSGYSLFETDVRGCYKLNFIGTDEWITRQLDPYIDKKLLEEIWKELETLLARWIDPCYAGYLGIDMMLCETADGFRLHPCVEINLRMNMGTVAHIVADRYVHPDAHGRYIIEYHAQKGEAYKAHQCLKEAFPLQIIDGRIYGGYFPLTPVNADTHYRIYLLIG